MHHVWIILVCLVVVALILQVAARGSSRSSWPVFARPVMSEVERGVYARLVQELPNRLVFPQVQLCRFVEVKNVQQRYSILNRYSRLSADFVICRTDSAVEVVVELDDASHQSRDARSRDAKKDAVLNAAGIRVVRLHVRSLPSVQDLRALLFPAEGSAVTNVQSGRRA